MNLKDNIQVDDLYAILEDYFEEQERESHIFYNSEINQNSKKIKKIEKNNSKKIINNENVVNEKKINLLELKTNQNNFTNINMLSKENYIQKLKNLEIKIKQNLINTDNLLDLIYEFYRNENIYTPTEEKFFKDIKNYPKILDYKNFKKKNKSKKFYFNENNINENYQAFKNVANINQECNTTETVIAFNFNCNHWHFGDIITKDNDEIIVRFYFCKLKFSKLSKNSFIKLNKDDLNIINNNLKNEKFKNSLINSIDLENLTILIKLLEKKTILINELRNLKEINFDNNLDDNNKKIENDKLFIIKNINLIDKLIQNVLIKFRLRNSENFDINNFKSKYEEVIIKIVKDLIKQLFLNDLSNNKNQINKIIYSLLKKLISKYNSEIKKETQLDDNSVMLLSILKFLNYSNDKELREIIQKFINFFFNDQIDKNVVDRINSWINNLK